MISKILITIILSLTSTKASKPHSTVQDLTDASFDSALKDPANDLWFLKFYAPWYVLLFGIDKYSFLIGVGIVKHWNLY